jgi:hypothetical protein
VVADDIGRNQRREKLGKMVDIANFHCFGSPVQEVMLKVYGVSCIDAKPYL